MKTLLLTLIVLLGIGCNKEDLELQRALNDVTFLGTPVNWMSVQKIPALVSRKDSMEMVAPLIDYFQSYDSFCIERVQPERTISGTTYSVTNDSAIYIISFFSPTKHKDYHPIYFNNRYNAVEIAQQ